MICLIINILTFFQIMFNLIMNKTLLKIYSLIIFLFFSIQVFGQAVIINEFMSSNDSGIQDYEGNYSDWIELYNNSNEEINLFDFALSDDISNYRKWIFPNINIQPKGYLIIYASGNDTICGKELHTNFKIKQAGEILVLTNSHCDVLSLIEAVFVPTDKSFACTLDGNGIMNITDMPTPNSLNIISDNVYCSHPSGFYKDSFNLTLSASDINHEIHYTLNGEIPSQNSKLYKAPIRIKNNSQTPLNFSLIPTTPLSGESQLYDFIWKEPKNVYKCNVIRFAAFENDTMRGGICTRNFFVDNEIADRYTFPIVSIVTDSLNLFDYDTGIYIPGKRFDENGFNYWPEGNYLNKGEEWERKIHISYFENKGLLAFETDAGMRMRGFSSTSNPQKSFTTYFRKEYGMKNIEYNIFKNSNAEKIKRLIFRNSGNDFLYSHFKDAMLQKIIEPMDLDLQAFQPSVVFINGEYWGIHNIREKYDKFYFKYKFDVEEDDINILGFCGQIEEGDNIDYHELTSFIKTNDLSLSENYDYVTEKLDIKNFIDFLIVEIYFANYDWPCNNFKIWKDNNPNSKWRFLIYDLDYSFGYDASSSYNANSMEHSTSTDNSWPYCECSNLIFRNLLLNDEFKNNFLDRFADCLENTFETNRVISVIDEFELMYSPEIEEHIDRWNYPASLEQWREEIDKLREFASERPCYMSENIMSYFHLSTYEFDCLKNNIQENDIFTLYPNPNDGNFVIFNDYEKDIEDGKVIIVNLFGQIVYSQENILINTKERFRFQLNNLADGMYVFHFTSKEISEIKKFIISSSPSKK